MIEIALDVSYPDKFIGSLVRAGYKIVCIAQEAEPDNVWLERAIDNGAMIIYSNDVDIPDWLSRNRLDHIKVIRNRKMPHQINDYTINRWIKEKKKELEK